MKNVFERIESLNETTKNAFVTLVTRAKSAEVGSREETETFSDLITICCYYGIDVVAVFKWAEKN